MDRSSTNTLGKYQIIREIARSNDIVYEALDPTINRRVALKELYMPPTLTTAQKRERIERFWREGKAAGRLSHPNIVSVFEVGKEGDRHFIAMEFLEGQTLRDVLQSGGPLPIQTAVDYTLQLCSALDYAHRNGVIHRDIKPENVQILPGGHIKLTDFGIARLVGEPGITQDGQVFGTPSYMSPEQVAGRPLDSRSDIFSLGVVLYEMIAGKKPFAGDSVVTITYNIVNMEPEPPPGAPPYLISVIRKAMAKDPDARYQSAEEMARDIREQRTDPMLATDPTGAAAFPSPFGAPPQQAGQQSVPGAPHGTPIPSPGAGSQAPDPFAQSAPPVPISIPPPRPSMSADTRNFVGILLLVLGVAGLALFAIWAVGKAYESYVIAQTSESAARYYEQGLKLHEQGRALEKQSLESMAKGQIGLAADQQQSAHHHYQLAQVQYLNAIRVSPKSKAADYARDGLYEIWVAQANYYSLSADKEKLFELGKKLIEADANKPEGHYYLGVAYELSRNYEEAAREYEQTSLLAGNDQAGYGKEARARLGRLNALMQQSQQTPSAPPPPPQPNESPIPYEPGTAGR